MENIYPLIWYRETDKEKALTAFKEGRTSLFLVPLLLFAKNQVGYLIRLFLLPKIKEKI